MTRSQRSLAGRAGAAASRQTRRMEVAQGRAFARAFRAARHPVAYRGPYPIIAHRTVAEIDAANPDALAVPSLKFADPHASDLAQRRPQDHA